MRTCAVSWCVPCGMVASLFSLVRGCSLFAFAFAFAEGTGEEALTDCSLVLDYCRAVDSSHAGDRLVWLYEAALVASVTEHLDDGFSSSSSQVRGLLA